jgi:hypothetical protein
VRIREAIVQAQGETDGSGVRPNICGVRDWRVGDLTSDALELIEEVRVELMLAQYDEMVRYRCCCSLSCIASVAVTFPSRGSFLWT